MSEIRAGKNPGDPTHGPVSAEIIGQMECCAECVTIRSRKPFMSSTYQRDYTPYELAALHVIYHGGPLVPAGNRRFA